MGALQQGKSDVDPPPPSPRITTLRIGPFCFLHTYRKSSSASRYLWTAGIVLLTMMFMVTIGIDEVGLMNLSSSLGISKEDDKSWSLSSASISSSSSSAQDMVDVEMKKLLNERVKYYSEQPEHERYKIVSKGNVAASR